jgi:blocked-early-in-transport protein 1
MSDAYERERQNNSRLSELSAKVTALRGVTVDIYDNARAQDVIDNTVHGLRVLNFGYMAMSERRQG